ncbi:MAG: hypothetical protein PHX83_00275 [Acidobacteriia bacterium]|nr:hypothetical protein [Terriglobia bacterium]
MPALTKSPGWRFGVLCIFGTALLAATGLAELKISPSAALSPEQSSSEISPGNQRLFEFHSGFWINLHHFLYQQALERRDKSNKDSGVSVSKEDDQTIALTPDESRLWSEAIDYYTAHMINRDLLRDEEMTVINNALSGAGNNATLASSGLNPDLKTALENASKAYRAHWWPKHDLANRTWVAAVIPLIERYGEGISEKLSAVYHTPWPKTAIPTDVTVYATFAGAYTSLGPTHITLSSASAGNQGEAALEVVFHEASHSFVRPVFEALSQEARTQNKILPRRDLWHAVLFYTTGEVVRQRLKAYVPYAEKNGLWTRAWPMYYELLKKDWQPYLDGSTTMEAAVRNLIRDVGVPATQNRTLQGQ